MKREVYYPSGVVAACVSYDPRTRELLVVAPHGWPVEIAAKQQEQLRALFKATVVLCAQLAAPRSVFSGGDGTGIMRWSGGDSIGPVPPQLAEVVVPQFAKLLRRGIK